MMGFLRRQGPGLLAVWVMSLSLLSGTVGTRTLRGTVSGPDGKPVSGAVVKIKNLVTLHIRSFLSLGDGSYYFAGLNPDIEYEVWASRQGVSSDVKALSRFDSAKEPSIDLRLK